MSDHRCYRSTWSKANLAGGCVRNEAVHEEYHEGRSYKEDGRDRSVASSFSDVLFELRGRDNPPTWLQTGRVVVVVVVSFSIRVFFLPFMIGKSFARYQWL